MSNFSFELIREIEDAIFDIASENGTPPSVVINTALQVFVETYQSLRPQLVAYRRLILDSAYQRVFSESGRTTQGSTPESIENDKEE